MALFGDRWKVFRNKAMADAGDAEPRLVVMRGGNITPGDTALLASQCAAAGIDFMALDSVGLASNSSVTRDPSNVFVCDPFDGPIFARLYSAGCRSAQLTSWYR